MSNVRHRIFKIFSQIQPVLKSDEKNDILYEGGIFEYPRDVAFNKTLMSCVSQCNEHNGFWTRTVKQTWQWFPRHVDTIHSFWWKVQARRVLFLLQPVELKFQALQRSQNSVRALYKADNMGIAWVRPESLSGCSSACINTKSKRQTLNKRLYHDLHCMDLS